MVTAHIRWSVVCWGRWPKSPKSEPNDKAPKWIDRGGGRDSYSSGGYGGTLTIKAELKSIPRSNTIPYASLATAARLQKLKSQGNVLRSFGLVVKRSPVNRSSHFWGLV